MTEGSTPGMIISIVTTLIITAIMYTEITSFFTDRYTHVLQVDQFDRSHDRMTATLDITFLHAPCHILSLDV